MLGIEPNSEPYPFDRYVLGNRGEIHVLDVKKEARSIPKSNKVRGQRHRERERERERENRDVLFFLRHFDTSEHNEVAICWN